MVVVVVSNNRASDGSGRQSANAQQWGTIRDRSKAESTETEIEDRNESRKEGKALSLDHTPPGGRDHNKSDRIKRLNELN